MADTHLKIGGVWKAIDNAYVKIGGAWKQVDNVYVKIGGAWKKAWENWVVGVDGSSRTKTADPVPASGVGFEWRTDGTVYNDNGIQQDASTDWIIPNAAASNDYEIRFTEVSAGANWAYSAITPDGSTWYGLGTQRNLKGGSTNSNAATCTVLVEIRYDGGSVEDSANYSITAEPLV